MYNNISTNEKQPKDKFDLAAFGRAVQDARVSKGWTREYLAERLGLTPKYVQYIEIRGQHPSFQVFMKS
jgi:transcriptional regulator with XRE-family HTH domain